MGPPSQRRSTPTLDCRTIPDFRKTMTEAHTRLLARLYGHLMGRDGWLPADWMPNEAVRRALRRLARAD